jgi:hypothetical protein
MEKDTEQLEALRDIRRMMRESSRFLSLSGLSGILAGLYALAGAFVAQSIIDDFGAFNTAEAGGRSPAFSQHGLRLVVLSLAVVTVSLVTAFLLTARKARRQGHRLFDHSSRKLFWAIALPLISGGIFCVALLAQGGNALLLICPAMLVFYGLALLAGSRYTLGEVRALGFSQLAAGLVSCFLPAYGLLFWSLGFGLFHIIYGVVMWYRYDRIS